MIYSVRGMLVQKKETFAVCETGGIGYKISAPARVLAALPGTGSEVFFYCHPVVREDAHELYGFLAEGDLAFFEKLLTVNGVGPKSALAIMALSEPRELAAAITEGRADVFMRAAGVGKKTAERVVLELRGKLPSLGSEESVHRMEGDMDVIEALVGLGYLPHDAKRVVAELPQGLAGIEARLKSALKLIKKP